jgi:hypothetical protein
MKRIVMLLLLVFAGSAQATTYYVRVDGGTATQCTGTTDAAYPGSGTAQACAFAGPMVALPSGSDAAKLQPGDTLHIASGSYVIGYGAPGTTAGNCHSDGTPLCVIASIPSGLDAAHPTTITGDCSAPPELWATGGLQEIFNIVGKHDIALACLNLTDHSSCSPDGRATSQPKCAYGSGPWGNIGIRVADVTNLTLTDLDVHGFAATGIQAGRLSGTTTVTRVKIVGNGRAGWNGDLGGNTATSGNNSGTLTFTDLTIAWTGCLEAYPPNGTQLDCAGSNSGGYGDGFSLAHSGGVYSFIRPKVYKNTSDGLDLLYADGTGSVTVDHGFFARNVGNDIKTSGPATVTNNVIISDCRWWSTTTHPAKADVCRAGGGIEGNFTAPNETVTFAHNTMIGNPKGMYESDATFNQTSTPVSPSDVIDLHNNIFIGIGSPWMIWAGDPPNNPATIRWSNNIMWGIANSSSWSCATPGNQCVDPQLTNETLDSFNPVPLPGSPAWTISAGANQ